MQVTNRQAFVIARTLYKGMNAGESFTGFSVWRDGQAIVGIKRKRNKYFLFVQVDGKYDKSVKYPYFTKNIDLQLLADNVEQALNESVMLQDKELDTERSCFKDLEPEVEEIQEDITEESYEDYEEEYQEDDGYSIPDDGIEEETAEEASEDDSEELSNSFDEIDTESDQDPFEGPTGDTEEEPEPIEKYTDKKVNVVPSNKGFDIFNYLYDEKYGGTIMDRSKRVATAVADWEYDSEKLADNVRKPFIKLLDALMQAMMFDSMTNEEASIRVDTLHMKDVSDFIVSKDMNELDEFFKGLPSSHLALIPYKVFSYALPEVKANVMQELVMRISNYATDEFDEAFSAINEEIDAADKREEEMLAKANTEPAEVIDMFESVDDVINKELTDKNGEPNPYAPLYAETEETGVSTEVKTLSMLQQQIDSRRDEFAKSMNNLFKEIVDKYPEQAEILYFIAVEIALDANDKDAMKLAQAIDADPRDVIMADYEYKLRIKDKDLNDLKAKTN